MATPNAGAAPDRLRRAMILGGAAATAVVGWQGLRAWQRARAGEFDFLPLQDPAGFRLLSAGDVTSGGFLDPLAGLEDGSSDAARAAARSDLCGTLFGADRVPEGVTPIAAFSDYNCPYCRVLTKRLAERQAASGGTVHVRWHEWPLFGEASDLYARAALAADRQGAYAALHARFMRTRFVPNEAYMRRVSEEMGLNTPRLLRDMISPETDLRIAQARALASIFGFPGTPSMVVGRTAVIGAIPLDALDALIARERAEGPPPRCA
ncbi:MAG: DsbA family protein [Pseudomonadota bacterium]